MTYYEITQDEADLIGFFQVDDNNYIDPYCGKQVNGNYIIKKSTVDDYAERAEIKAVDFSSKTTKTINQLDFEIESL